MDYPRDNVFTFLFSTYKRTSGVVFTAIIILAVPITILLVGREQDIRQQAAESTSITLDRSEACKALSSQIKLLEQTDRCTDTSDDACQDAKSRFSLLNCDGSKGACVPEPENCKSIFNKFLSLWTGACLEPQAGWCPATNSTDSFSTPTPSQSQKVLAATDSVAGPRSPTIAINDTSIGTSSWSLAPGSSPLNVLALDGGVAYCSCSSMNYVKTTGYGFNIPTTNIITGIRVEVAAINNGGIDQSIKLVKGGVIQGADRARGAALGGSNYVVYGGDSDLWGLTLTPADVNATNFGSAVSTRFSTVPNQPGSPNIDHIRMTVYHKPAPTNTPTPSPTNSPTPTAVLTNTPTPTPFFICSVQCVEPPTGCHYEGGSRTANNCTCGTLVCPNVTLSQAPDCQFKEAGDANCDEKVNTDDFNIWRDEFLGILSTKNSDFNSSETINTDDFNIWRDGFLSTSIPH